MNRLFVLSIFVFARARSEGYFYNGQEHEMPENWNDQHSGYDVLASVRQYPSQLHKCSATFIAADVLLTTAKCLFCEDCELFVHALSSHLTDGNGNLRGMTFNISKIAIHPNYERFPSVNDIGLIKLKYPVEKAAVFALPTRLYELTGLKVNTYRWQFTSNFQEYYLEKLPERTLSSGLCSLILNQFIDYTLMCTRRDKSLSLGQFDEGAPLIRHEKGKNFVIGIYGKEGLMNRPKVEIYQTVFPYVEWIRRIIKCRFECAGHPLDSDTVLGIEDSSAAPDDVTTNPDQNLLGPNHNSPSTEGPPGPRSTEENALPHQDPVIQASGETQREPELVSEHEPAGSPEEPKAEALHPGSGAGQKKTSAPKWTADFPFSEQKKAPFRPKNFPV